MKRLCTLQALVSRENIPISLEEREVHASEPEQTLDGHCPTRERHPPTKFGDYVMGAQLERITCPSLGHSEADEGPLKGNGSGHLTRVATLELPSSITDLDTFLLCNSIHSIQPANIMAQQVVTLRCEKEEGEIQLHDYDDVLLDGLPAETTIAMDVIEMDLIKRQSEKDGNELEDGEVVDASQQTTQRNTVKVDCGSR